jgi:integrase
LSVIGYFSGGFMDKIIEYKGYFGNNYLRISGNKEYEVTVIAITKVHNDFTYMFLVGSNGKVYFDTYKYLNEVIGNKGSSTRQQSLQALKWLYSYFELFNTDIKYLDEDDKNRLIAFLRGSKGTGRYVSYDLKTKRKNDTVNKYLGVYRSFYRYLKIENNIFEETNGVKKITNGSSYNSKETSIEVQTYSMNLQEVNRNVVPKYIRYTEYVAIEKLIEKKFTLREKIMIKLMYEYGLRIGEVLGLTLEDIQGEKITKQKGKCRLILRDRFTDKPWQRAKGCMKITSRDDYNKEGYYEEGDGYQVVPITTSTYDLIQEYIDETTSPFSMSDKAYENYTKKNNADKVSNTDIDRNAYVFISKNYTPIAGGSWNKIVKKIYKEIGIDIDQGTKEDNLSHRFRHGFAMYKVLYEGYDELKLAYVLRHSNTKSAKKYFNPTEDDLIQFAIKQDELTKRGLGL